jgi:hypothetical protein
VIFLKRGFFNRDMETKSLRARAKSQASGVEILIANLSAEEREACVQAAEFEGMTLSEWVRAVLLRASGLVLEDE